MYQETFIRNISGYVVFIKYIFFFFSPSKLCGVCFGGSKIILNYVYLLNE
jgi:hypothetical protein